jgi:coatomer protein complex subunit alpha (xenin)
LCFKDAIRIAELAAYFTHCNLEPPHLQLTLRSAMAICVKLKNLQSAASFARRLVDLAPPQNVVEQAQKVLIFCEQNKFVEEKPMKYDERNPFVICGSTFTPIYKGSPLVRCTYCSAPYMPELQGKQCQICMIAEIGRENCSGLQVMQNK